MSYWAIQTAVHAALTGDAQIMAVATAVHDHPAPDTAYPYITIGDGEHEAWDTDSDFGFESRVLVHVWDRIHRGRKTVKELQAEIYRVLHHQPLTLDGLIHVLTVCELAETFPDEDGLTYHGVQRFHILSEKE